MYKTVAKKQPTSSLASTNLFPLAGRQTQKAFVLCAAQYPALFANQWLGWLVRTVGYLLVSIDLDELTTAQVTAQLEMSFLGQQCVYWLGDLSVLSAKQQAQWQRYIAKYTGPHVLAAFSPAEVGTVTIMLPPQVDARIVVQLLPLWPEADRERIKFFLDRAIVQVGVLPLESVMRLVNYGAVAGASREVFMRTWLPRLVPSQTSLFALSGALFARDSKTFLQQWSAVRDQYPAQFWIAYFSEQLFRAYFYADARKQGQENKKIGYRLPFSFLQRDWQRWQPVQLLAAHEAIAHFDWRAKNGGLEQFLDAILLTVL